MEINPGVSSPIEGRVRNGLPFLQLSSWSPQSVIVDKNARFRMEIIIFSFCVDL